VTVQTLLQSVLRELGFSSQNSFVNATDEGALRALAFMHECGQEMRRYCAWPQLLRSATITLVDGQGEYELPGDLDHWATETVWNQNEYWKLIGPLREEEWRTRKTGIVQTGPRQTFRVAGMQDGKFEIHPIPGASQAGQVVILDYYSTNWIRPAKWAASTAYSANQYTFNDGNFYRTTSGGTSGGAMRDDDVPLLPQLVLKSGIKSKWMYLKGLQWEKYESDYQNGIRVEYAHSRGGSRVPLNRERVEFGISDGNVPDSGYG
jgi:hypothetical protein